MKKLLLSLATLGVLALFSTSCATIFTGTSDQVTFESNPSGATVFVDGVELCITPCKERVDRSVNDQEVEFVLDGYKTKVIELDKEFNVISIINLGSPLGWVVDLITGSVRKCKKKYYRVDLERNWEAQLSGAKEIHIDTSNKSLEIIKVAKTN